MNPPSSSSPSSLPASPSSSQPVPSKPLLVRTEFVFRTHNLIPNTVQLVGDWTLWRPISLTPESNSTASPRRPVPIVWSVITPVPPGRRLFCYLTDGRPTPSLHHPITPDGKLNVRDVHGPRPRSSRPHGLLARLDSLADAAAGPLHAAFAPRPRALPLFHPKRPPSESPTLYTSASLVSLSLRVLATFALVYLSVAIVLHIRRLPT